MFLLVISRSILKLGHMGQKIGHQAKLKEDLVITLEVTFFKIIIMNIAQNARLCF